MVRRIFAVLLFLYALWQVFTFFNAHTRIGQIIWAILATCGGVYLWKQSTMDKSSNIPKELLRVANLFKISSLILVLMAASFAVGIGMDDIPPRAAITGILLLGSLGIFFLYLSGQLLSFKRWAKNVCLTISLFIAIFFTYAIVFEGLAFSLFPIITIFFYLSSFYLTRPKVKELFK